MAEEKLKKYTVLFEGKEVAGMRSPGKGEQIELTKEQAEHPLRTGVIEKYKEPKPEPETEEQGPVQSMWDAVVPLAEETKTTKKG